MEEKKQELDRKRESIEIKLTYGRNQIKYLQEEILHEYQYQRRIAKKREDNQRNFFLFGIISGGLALLAIGIYWFTDGFMVVDLSNPLRIIAIILLLPIFVFCLIGLAFLIRKVIRYGSQLRGTEDPRLRGGYKTYDSMWQTSQARMKYLKEELDQTMLAQEANRSLLQECIRETAAQKTEVIGMEELQQVIEEKKPQLEQESPVCELQDGEQVIDMGELKWVIREKKGML